MTIDQLKTAFERRGYVLVVFCQDVDAVKLVARLGERAMPWSISLLVLETIKAGIGNLIEHEFQRITDGQQHVQHDCGFPLLREVKNAGSKETLAYRAAPLGPTSKPVWECPQCWQYIQDDSVQEIVDL
jgi:hypothetical protein